jgi:hypothetical protein
MSAETLSQTIVQLRFSLRSKVGAALLAIPVCLATAAAAYSRTPSFPESNITRGRTAAGHSYQSGGIGIDEQQAMERASDPYNLKLVFASGAGTFAAPVFVVIGANHGRAVEKVTVRAPWFYIRLPPGGYTILARFARGIVLIRDVYLQEGRLRMYRLRAD